MITCNRALFPISNLLFQMVGICRTWNLTWFCHYQLICIMLVETNLWSLKILKIDLLCFGKYVYYIFRAEMSKKEDAASEAILKYFVHQNRPYSATVSCIYIQSAVHSPHCHWITILSLGGCFLLIKTKIFVYKSFLPDLIVESGRETLV